MAYHSDAALMSKPAAALAPVEPELMKVFAEAQTLREMANTARKDIQAFVDRVRGEEPTCDEACRDREGFGAGIIGDIRRTNETTRDVLDDLNSLARQLRSIG